MGIPVLGFPRNVNNSSYTSNTYVYISIYMYLCMYIYIYISLSLSLVLCEVDRSPLFCIVY